MKNKVKKFPLFLQIARWRMLSLFKTYFDKLQSRIVLIAGISLCMISPQALAAYYRSLSEFQLSSWMIASFIGIALISIHGKINPEVSNTFAFEKTLPLSLTYRIALDYLDSVWIQLPLILFVLLGALSDRLDFHNQQPVLLRIKISVATASVIFINLLLSRLISVKSTQKRSFYFNSPVMKAKAIFNHYPFFSQMTLLWVLVMSFIGAAIAKTTHSAQPKIFLYFSFFGLQILPLSKIPALLSEWDAELRPFLNTLPGKSIWTNITPYSIPAGFLLLQGTFWVILSYASLMIVSSFVLAALLTIGLFLLLQLKFAKWALTIGILITLTGATALQASVP